MNEQSTTARTPKFATPPPASQTRVAQRTHGAIAERLVTGHNDVGQNQAAKVENAAAETGNDGCELASARPSLIVIPAIVTSPLAMNEDPADVIAADLELFRARTLDVQVLVDGQRATGQRDCPSDAEGDRVATDGATDGLAQRAGPLSLRLVTARVAARALRNRRELALRRSR
jgi:hypothetical protein